MLTNHMQSSPRARQSRRGVATTDAATTALIDAARKWLDESEDQHLLTWGHPDFPTLLLENGDVPVILFAKGRLDLLARAALAMVGSRHCSQGGTDAAKAFAEAFSASGVTVVTPRRKALTLQRTLARYAPPPGSPLSLAPPSPLWAPVSTGSIRPGTRCWRTASPNRA